jgi:hypothetical protein
MRDARINVLDVWMPIFSGVSLSDRRTFNSSTLLLTAGGFNTSCRFISIKFPRYEIFANPDFCKSVEVGADKLYFTLNKLISELREEW